MVFNEFQILIRRCLPGNIVHSKSLVFSIPPPSRIPSTGRIEVSSHIYGQSIISNGEFPQNSYANVFVLFRNESKTRYERYVARYPSCLIKQDAV